jgi:hypothetical protein
LKAARRLQSESDTREHSPRILVIAPIDLAGRHKARVVPPKVPIAENSASWRSKDEALIDRVDQFLGQATVGKSCIVDGSPDFYRESAD